MRLTRREFVAIVAVTPLARPGESHYRVGITTNTRGGWEDDVFLSFREAREVGFRHVESFIHYFTAYLDRPHELRRIVDQIGVGFETISNGSPMERHFEDPSKHRTIIEEHMRLVRFIKHLGCDHLKINMGPRRLEGTTGEDLGNMAEVLNELGKRISDDGLKLGVHAHMWSQFENRGENRRDHGKTPIPSMSGLFWIRDTLRWPGSIPWRSLANWVIASLSFILKIRKPKHRGGAKEADRSAGPDEKIRSFFELGKGGVRLSRDQSALGQDWLARLGDG